MNRIQLHQSDISFSRLVYGVWRLADDTDTSSSHVQRKIESCLEQGITTFDHADIYGNYECESVFGQALKQKPDLRDRMEIISKCDICLMSEKFPNRRVKYYDTSASYIQKSVENSLSNLNTDFIDTLLLHRPDPLMDASETGAALDQLIQSGKVRTVGVSNFSPSDWRLLQDHMSHKLVVNQVEMSLFVQSSFTDGTLAEMQRDKLQAMAWSPLAGGELFSSSDAAKRVQPFLQKLASPHGGRIDLVAIAWLLRHPAQIIPVLGTNNLNRIDGIAGACDIEMDRETWFELWVAATGQEVP